MNDQDKKRGNRERKTSYRDADIPRRTRQEVRDRKTAEIDPEKAEESFLSGHLEGRNAVIEAYRSGRTVERLYVQEGIHDGPVETILREETPGRHRPRSGICLWKYRRHVRSCKRTRRSAISRVA